MAEAHRQVTGNTQHTVGRFQSSHTDEHTLVLHQRRDLEHSNRRTHPHQPGVQALGLSLCAHACARASTCPPVSRLRASNAVHQPRHKYRWRLHVTSNQPHTRTWNCDWPVLPAPHSNKLLTTELKQETRPTPISSIQRITCC